MLRSIFILLIVSIGISAAGARERSLPDRQIDTTLNSNKIVFIDGKPAPEKTQHYVDSVRKVIATFYYDQFRNFSDPGAPYFLFMSKDANLAMGIGGCVRMRAYYDWGGAIPASGFAPYLIPMHPSPTDMKHFDTTPAGTCIFFRVIGRNKLLGNYQLYIEANFNGYKARDFHLKKAYAIINNFTVGYANSTFSDPMAVPPTVDAQGPNNKISPTALLVRFMPVIKNKWVFAVSAETPSPELAVDNEKTASVSNWMPDFAAFAQYQWGDGEHVRLSGILRTLSYRDLISNKNYNKVGWAVQLSSVAHPWPQVTTYATVNYGAGYGSLGGDLIVGKYDLIGYPGRPGKMYAPRSLGWCVGFQYNFLPNLFMSISASQSHYMPSHDVDDSEYKRGFFGDINIFWNMTARMQLGAEFDLGRRQNFDGTHRWARRIGAMCQFSF